MLEKNGDESSLLEEIIKSDESDKKEEKSILDLNLGGAAGCSRMNEIIDKLKDKLSKEAITKINRIQIMMNIKPDIAVIFEREDGVYLKFLECKFESSEGSYNSKKDYKGESYLQTEAQNWVGEFLCKELRIKTEIKDDKKTEIKTIEWEGSKLIYFRRQKSERKNVILLEEMMHFCRIPK